MDRTYPCFKGGEGKDFVIASMKKYAEQEQEIDKFLESLIAPLINGKQLSILDACCGIGHLVCLLWDLGPQSSFVGVDHTPYLVEHARDLCRERENLSFEVGDVYDLPAKYPKRFDISLNWKTISWLPSYERMLQSLVALTRKHIFLSSLFYDGDIDFEIKVKEYRKEEWKDGFISRYNVYSFPHFRNFVYGLGVRDIHAYDFEIGVDIPRPPLDLMGTYTMKLENGKRMQISGTVVMSWKVIRIDL